MDYSEIYETLRKEKYSETLQPLPKEFISEISHFLNEKKQEQEKEPSSIIDTSLTSKKQLENSIAIFKELILRRKRKILNLVFVATETGIMKRDYENMLPFERDVFEKLVKAFEDGDKELSKTLSGNKNKENKNRMIMFSQNSEQFVDMSGNPLGPYASGELVNLPSEVAEILVSSGKATFVDEE